MSVNTTVVKDWGQRSIGHQRSQGQSRRASGGPARVGDTVIVIVLVILIVMIAQESGSGHMGGDTVSRHLTILVP